RHRPPIWPRAAARRAFARSSWGDATAISPFTIAPDGTRRCSALQPFSFSYRVLRRRTAATDPPAGRARIDDPELTAMADPTNVQRVHGYCGLCIARCGSVAVVESGRFTRLEPDPEHPTGQAVCAKGRAAPELVYHSERLKHPLRRTRPKGD